MTLALQTVFSGLVNGSVFALIGLGVVLCYRGSRVVNLAQGETYMICGVLCAKLVGWGYPLWAGALCGVVAAGLAGWLLERLVIRSRINWDIGRLIVVTVGVAFVLEGAADLVIGANPLVFPPLLSGGSVIIDSAALSPQDVLLIGLTVGITIGVVVFLRRTLLGHALTASAENPNATGTLGVNVNAMRSIAFTVAGVFGGVAALLLVPASGVSYNAGLPLTLNGFAAAAFANMVSPGRVCVAGLFLGLAEGVVGSYWNPALEVPVVFGVLLVLGVAYLARGERFGGAVRA